MTTEEKVSIKKNKYLRTRSRLINVEPFTIINIILRKSEVSVAGETKSKPVNLICQTRFRIHA